MRRPLTLLLIALLPFSVIAAPGDLDTSFGGGAGWVSTGFERVSDANGQSAIQQMDGKLVTAGYSHNGSNYDFALARYNPDGSLDPTFDGDGKLTTAIGTGDDFALSVIQQTDGKLVLAGQSYNGSNYDFALVRYNLDGSLDTTFNSDGLLTMQIGVGNDHASSVIQQTDGKLVLAGRSHNGSNYDFALARYNPDGSQDTTFDGDGIVKAAVGISDDYGSSVIQQADGKLVVTGYSITGSDSDFSLARFNSNGSLDTTFDGDGKRITMIGTSYDQAYSVIQQQDGKLVVAGYSSNGTNSDFALVRYNLDGSLDTAFDADGKLTTVIAAGNDVAQSVTQQLDGKLVVAGHSSNGSNYDFALVRYNLDGSLDTTFDGDGKLTTAISSGNDYAYSALLEAEGTIVVAGDSGGNFATVRYSADGSLEMAFGENGIVCTAFSYSQDTGRSIIQQTDGKLVVVGDSHNGSNIDFAMARYNLDGSLDTMFDGDGKLITEVGISYDQAYSVIQQQDGKLVAAGFSHNGSNFDFALVRYNLDGSLDTTFDGDGKLTTAIGISHDSVRSLIQQTDGKLVAAGYTTSAGSGDFALVRYNLDGSLDTTFDGDGKLTTAIATGNDVAESVTQQSDGKLVVAGYSSNGSNNDFALVRYNLDGSLDANFDGDGKLTTAIGTGDELAYSVIQQTDGKLAAAGYIRSNGSNDFALTRYNTDGSLDITLDGDGKLSVDMGSHDAARSLIQQSDGKLVLAGDAPNRFVVLRCNLDGSLDTAFGAEGKLIVTLGITSREAYSVVQQYDGKLAVAGYVTYGGANWNKFVIVRLESGQLNTDADGYIDNFDDFPLNPDEWLDTDSDGTGNNADPDDDNDALPDVMDPLPLQAQFNLDGNYNGSSVRDRATVY